ncbi:MAG: hypothetical protein AAGU27_26125 [Dehalobacterium sp.]
MKGVIICRFLTVPVHQEEVGEVAQGGLILISTRTGAVWVVWG